MEAINVRTNKDLKTQVETLLLNNGFWVCDYDPLDKFCLELVSIKNDRGCLILPRISKEVSFYFEKITEHERELVERWIRRTKTTAYLALLIAGAIYLLDYNFLFSQRKKGKKKLKFLEIIENSQLFENFLGVEDD